MGRRKGRPAAVVVFKRCGKDSCACAEDPRRRHGPYIHYVWRERLPDGSSVVRTRYGGKL